MKKSVLFILFIFVTLVLHAQEEHLKFMDIPMDCSVREFTSQLKKKGLKKEGKSKNGILFSGKYASFTDCYIALHFSDKTNLIETISVALKKQNEWSSLYYDFQTIKEKLTEQYGEPFSLEEKWLSDFEPSGDAVRMFYVRSNKCKYEAKYIQKSGTIIVSINSIGPDKDCQVMVFYYDRINNIIGEEKNLDDL